MEELNRFNTVLGSGYITLPDAKGSWNESNPLYLGTYWAGSPLGVKQIVEDSDLVLLVGALLNDYTTVGWTSMMKTQNLIEIFTSYVVVCGKLYSNVNMADLLAGCTNLPLKDGSLKKFNRNNAKSDCKCNMTFVPFNGHTPLQLKEMQHQLQQLLSSKTSLISETGDSWFIGQEMKLPDGAKCHYQMQYGSTGWAVCAALGVAMAVGDTRQVIVLTGDSAFQMSAQEVATMIKQRVNITVFVINNRGYTFDEAHYGRYTDIKNWDYAGLIKVLDAGEGVGIGVKARTLNDLQGAIECAKNHKGVYLIEIIIDGVDCTPTLLEFGSQIVRTNGRIL